MESNYAFVPAYYEWHLIEKSNPEKVLFNLVDPIEMCYLDNGKPVDFDDLVNELDFATDDALRVAYEKNDKEQIENLSRIGKCHCYLMARALYDYYIA